MNKIFRLLPLVFSTFTISNSSFARWVVCPLGGDITCLAVSGTNVFAGSDYGVFLSTNNGANWTHIGLTNSFIRSLAIFGTNLFAGSYGHGVFLSTDNGASWTAVNNGLTDIDIRALAVAPNGTGGTNVFAGTNGGVYRTTDNGASWTAANTGLPTNIWVNALALSPNGTGGTNLVAGSEGSGVFLSTDNGASWTAVNTGLAAINAYTLAVSGTNVFAGTDWGIFLSTDNGASWPPVDSGFAGINSVHALAVSPNGTGGTNVFAAVYGFSYGVFLSSDNGTSWTAVNTGLPPYQNVTALVVSPPDSSGSGNLFAAASWTGVKTSGVFRSTNNGTSWIRASHHAISLQIGETGRCCYSGAKTASLISCVIAFTKVPCLLLPAWSIRRLEE